MHSGHREIQSQWTEAEKCSDRRAKHPGWLVVRGIGSTPLVSIPKRPPSCASAISCAAARRFLAPVTMQKEPLAGASGGNDSLRSSVATTTEHKGRSPERVCEPDETQRRRAAALVDEADRLVSEVLRPGRWPQSKTVERFLDEGRLERLLSLYSHAMSLDPFEPAYPWNLSSVLRRLGQNDLAVAFLTRAIRTGEKAGEDDFHGADAYLALAETAVDMGDWDLALLAVARACDLGEDRDDVGRYARRLLGEIRPHGGEESMRRCLMRLLERVAG